MNSLLIFVVLLSVGCHAAPISPKVSQVSDENKASERIGPSDADHEKNAAEFAQLDAKAHEVLRLGMSTDEVRKKFGTAEYTQIDSEDNSIERWSYLSSLSGTVQYWVTFRNGKLITYGAEGAH